jgi:hypothetical protein
VGLFACQPHPQENPLPPSPLCCIRYAEIKHLYKWGQRLLKS